MMLIVAVGSGMFFGLWRPQAPETIARVEADLTPASIPEDADEREEWIVVHVSGRVAYPGLVRVGAHARVGEVIEAAGGALGDARLGEINLAAPVSDGGQVMVPGPGTGVRSGDVGAGIGEVASSKVNLNRATARELEEVPGLGPVLARRIVDHRRGAGPFREVEDLLEVSGIGEKKLAGLREHVVLP